MNDEMFFCEYEFACAMCLPLAQPCACESRVCVSADLVQFCVYLAAMFMSACVTYNVRSANFKEPAVSVCVARSAECQTQPGAQRLYE